MSFGSSFRSLAFMLLLSCSIFRQPTMGMPEISLEVIYAKTISVTLLFNFSANILIRLNLFTFSGLWYAFKCCTGLPSSSLVKYPCACDEYAKTVKRLALYQAYSDLFIITNVLSTISFPFTLAAFHII